MQSGIVPFAAALLGIFFLRESAPSMQAGYERIAEADDESGRPTTSPQVKPKVAGIRSLGRPQYYVVALSFVFCVQQMFCKLAQCNSVSPFLRYTQFVL